MSPKKKKIKSIVCANCGELGPKHSNRQKYCSRLCQRLKLAETQMAQNLAIIPGFADA